MDKTYDLLIIGGGSAGLSAGIYAGRAKLNTLIIEKDKIGGQTITTSELVNYPGIRTTTGPKLMDDMRLHALDFGVEFTAGDIETLVNADKLPVVSLLNTNKEYSGVKFHGIPGGHELNSFVLAIYNLGGPGQAIDANITSKVQAIDKPINLKVCISLSCQLCPDMVVAAQRIAMLNPNIETEMVDISLFPDIRKKYKIMSVPAIIVNDDKIYFGAKKIDEILELI